MRSLSLKRAGLIVLALLLVLWLANCEFRTMFGWEVEEELKKRYGREFTVRSSASVTEDYYDDDVYFVKLYVVSPKDDPDTCFYAYNIVEGESFGVPGFRNSLTDTYSLDIFRKAFETRAADTDVEYAFHYTYPVKSSSVYYSHLNINIEQVTPENLEIVCTLLSRAYADTFEIVRDIPSWAAVRFRYRDPAWPEEESCFIMIGSYELRDLDTDAGSIEEYILREVNRYEERNALAD